MDNYLIVIDLDGTTLTNRHTIHELNKEAIMKLNRFGHKVVIATGRSLHTSLKYYQELELDTFLITRNGAFVFHPRTKQIIKDITIPKESLKSMLIGNIRYNIKEIYIEHKEQIECMKCSGDGLKEDANYSQIKDVSTCTLIVHQDQLMKVETVLKGIPDIKYSYWKYQELYFMIEIFPIVVDKSHSFSYLADYYHLSHKRIIAIGDAINDLSMIKRATIGVAVQNATDEVKKQANIILDYTNNEGAVGRFLDDFFKLSSV